MCVIFTSTMNIYNISPTEQFSNCEGDKMGCLQICYLLLSFPYLICTTAALSADAAGLFMVKHPRHGSFHL